MTYDTDVAWIHDQGFSSYALNTTPGVLNYLARYGGHDGLVVDLGCGSGILARELVLSGHNVLGVDLSESMLALARKQAPEAEFRQGSILDVPIPRTSAILCLGEVLSYAAADLRSTAAITRFFRRVWKALLPGGMFLLDFAQPGRFPAGMPRHSHWTGEDWAILIDALPQKNKLLLVRQLTAFRKVGRHWRRTDETHRLRLFPDTEIDTILRAAGFDDPHFLRLLGHYRFPSGHSAAIAVKALKPPDKT